LDLVVVNTHGGGTDLSPPAFLFHNKGNGVFESVTNTAVTASNEGSWDCAWGDYDNDGYLDLFVANPDGHLNFLFHNNGDGTFERILRGSLATDQSSAGCAWGDYNNDGFLD